MSGISAPQILAALSGLMATGMDPVGSFDACRGLLGEGSRLSKFPFPLDPDTEPAIASIYGHVLAQEAFDECRTPNGTNQGPGRSLPSGHPLPLRSPDLQESCGEAFEWTWRDRGSNVRAKHEPAAATPSPGTSPVTPEDAARELVEAYFAGNTLPARLCVRGDDAELKEITKRFGSMPFGEPALGSRRLQDLNRLISPRYQAEGHPFMGIPFRK